MKNKNILTQYSSFDEYSTIPFKKSDNGFCVYPFPSMFDDFPIHFHDFFEIEIIAQGNATQKINGYTQNISSNTITFMTPSDFHEIHDITEPIIGYGIHFTESNISPQILSLLHELKGNSFPVPQIVFEQIYNECEQLFNEYISTNHMRTLIMKSILEKIILLCLRSWNEVSYDKNYPDDIRKILSFINKNFRTNITRDDVANHVHLNADYFSVKFHKTFGISFQEFVKKKRLTYARTLLLSTDSPINTICFSSGFHSITQFNRTFKKNFGQTPSEFRKITNQ